MEQKASPNSVMENVREQSTRLFITFLFGLKVKCSVLYNCESVKRGSRKPLAPIATEAFELG